MSTIFWLAVMIGFLILEAATVAMVSLWFAAGSLAALICSMLGAPIWMQIVLFLVTSGILLAALRPLVRKYFIPKITRTNAEGVVGTEGYVTQSIDNLSASGQVRLGAVQWTARSSDGKSIEEGTLVRVNRIEGNKVFVSPAEVPAKKL